MKKIISAVLLSVIFGILVFGGVYRTKARTNDNDGKTAKNQNGLFTESSAGKSVQQTRNSDHEPFTDENCDEEGHHGYANGQANINIGDGSQVSSENQSEKGERGKRSGSGQGGGLDPLTTAEIEALKLALNDEYHALAVYQSVIAIFGDVEPFVEIAASEQRHIDALVNQFNKHGLLVPENTWIDNISPYDSIQQACQAGVKTELANAELYDKLFSMSDDPNLTRVFRNLSNASVNSHLPQFESCQ